MLCWVLGYRIVNDRLVLALLLLELVSQWRSCELLGYKVW